MRDDVRGLFIVLEGGEGVGKTTQWRVLQSVLATPGTEVVALREPGGTVAGDALRALVLDPAGSLDARTEALVFAASRAELIARVVKPALERGAIVLVDRFLLSTYAYQGAGRALSLSSLRALNEFATQGIVPDLTLLLTLPLDESLRRVSARGGIDRMEREARSFHERVHGAFTEAATLAWQAAHNEIGPIVVVDANGSEQEVTERCARAIASRWPSRFAELEGVRG